MCLLIISWPEKKLAIQGMTQNRHHSLSSLLLAKALLPTTIYAYNHYRYCYKTLPIVLHLKVRPMTTQTSLCTCLSWMSTQQCLFVLQHLFIERYTKKTSSLSLNNTDPSLRKQYSYCPLWILWYTKNY